MTVGTGVRKLSPELKSQGSLALRWAKEPPGTQPDEASSESPKGTTLGRS
jgi:hypothetical protein